MSRAEAAFDTVNPVHGPAIRWMAMFATLVALTATGLVLGVDATTMAFIYQIAVIFLALWAGLPIAVGAAVVAGASYNYFFIPPLHTFHVDDPKDWTALAVFVISAVIVSRIVVAGQERAAEAERRRVETEASAHIDHLRESDAFKTSLLRAVSHDLTTPLTTIRIQTAALRRHGDDEQLARAIDSIESEVLRLNRRIDNLLTMARLESGRLVVHAEPTPAADVFRLLREHLPAVFASRPVTVRVSESCPDAYVDPSLLLEVLVNLAENAHRAAPPQTELELSAEAEGGCVRIEVSDRGPGLPEDTDVARRGLGLEIARALTAASGGTLTLDEREGGGTVARVSLPAARPTGESA
jgi:two-component system sensor histidine kinase KdpD